MGEVLQDYGALHNGEVSAGSAINDSAGDGNCEQSPFLPQPVTSGKSVTSSSRTGSKTPTWAGFTRLLRRLVSSGEVSSPTESDGSQQDNGERQPHHECGCDLPENEPLLKRLQRRSSRMDWKLGSSAVSPEAELRAIRSRLNFHFSDFHRKYKDYKKKPWKFVLQILKIILVSVQIGLFASSKANIADFIEDNKKAINHMFAGKGTDLYTVDSVHEHLLSVLDGFYHVQHRSIGAYDYGWSNGSAPPVDFCITYYKKGRVFAFNQSYQWDQSTYVECTPLDNSSIANNSEWISSTFTSTNFDRIVNITTSFSLMTLFLNGYGEPLCVALHILILLNNENHAGRIPLTVSVDSTFLKCYGNVVKTLSDTDFALSLTLDLVIVVVAVTATLLTLRSLVKTGLLARRISNFMRKYSDHRLTAKEVLRLFDFWHINSVIADMLLVTGTLLKLAVELKGDVATRNEVQHFTVCSFLLGVGGLLIWVGALRFLSYFHGYNVLLVTLRCALPALMRFMLCSGILYLAFAFCGWISLGTYHPKFRSLVTTSETLYSLLNGDDMFRTFELMPTKPLGPYIFSQVYLYIFISLFIYFVLSQFIALITETYTEVLNMKEEDFEHLNACGHILQLLEKNFDASRPPSVSGFNGTPSLGECSPCDEELRSQTPSSPLPPSASITQMVQLSESVTSPTPSSPSSSLLSRSARPLSSAPNAAQSQTSHGQSLPSPLPQPSNDTSSVLQASPAPPSHRSGAKSTPSTPSVPSIPSTPSRAPGAPSPSPLAAGRGAKSPAKKTTSSQFADVRQRSSHATVPAKQPPKQVFDLTDLPLQKR